MAATCNFTCFFFKKKAQKKAHLPNTITVHNLMILNEVELGSPHSLLDLTNSHVHHITVKEAGKKSTITE
jgi:hypothetical protein